MSLTDAVDDANSTGRDILAAIQELDSLAEAGNATLDRMSAQLDALISAGGGGGGGGAALGAALGGARGGAGVPRPPSRARGGGGAANLLPSSVVALGAHPAVAAALSAAQIVAPHIGSGIGSAIRGGDFKAGFEASVNRALGAVPFIGDALQFKGGNEIEDRTKNKVAQVVGEMEALGGDISGQDIRRLLREVGGMELRRQDAYDQVRVEAEKWFGNHPGARGNRPRFSTDKPWKKEPWVPKEKLRKWDFR